MTELSAEYMADSAIEIWMCNSTLVGLVDGVTLIPTDTGDEYFYDDPTFGTCLAGVYDFGAEGGQLHLSGGEFTICFWANMDADAFGLGPGTLTVELANTIATSVANLGVSDTSPPYMLAITPDDLLSDDVGATEFPGWNFYAMTWDGTNLKVWVNGSLEHTLTSVETNSWDAASADVWLYMTTPPGPGGEPATQSGGVLYALAIFDTAISGSRISDYALADIVPGEPPVYNFYGSANFAEGNESNAMFGNASTTYARFRAREVSAQFAANMTADSLIPDDDYSTYPGYVVKITTAGGSVVGTVTDALVGDITETMNCESDSLSFRLPVTDSLCATINEPYHEATVLRGGNLLGQGVIQNRSLVENGRLYEFKVVGVRWYAAQRTVSRFPKIEMFQNGSFNQGIPPWRALAAPAHGQHIAPSIEVSGEQWGSDNTSVLLSNSGKGDWIGHDPDPKPNGKMVYEGNDGFIYQHFGWIVPMERSEGDVFTLTAWMKVPSAGYTHPPYQERGLWIELFSDLNLPAGSPTIRTKSLQYAFVPLNDSTPKDTWLRCQVSMTVPMAQKAEPDGSYTKLEYAQTVSARLYCPTGTVFWNGASMTWNERIKFKNKTLGYIISQLFGVCQSGTYGKDSFRVSAGGGGGRSMDATYLFSNREGLDDILSDFLSTGGGIECRLHKSLSGERFLETAGRVGGHKSHLTITNDNAIGDISIETNGSEVENQIVVTADTSTRQEDNTTSGNGVYDDQGRDEGYASGGSPVLEGVHTAIQGSHPTSLPGQAARLRSFYGSKSEVITATVDDHFHYYWMTIKPGDTIGLNLSNSNASAVGTYRVVSQTLMASDGTTSFTLVDLAHAYNPL